MKKRHSRKYICEAIAYWEKQLKRLNEEGLAIGNGPAAYVNALRDACRNSSLPNAESDVDELMSCQPPVTKAEFMEMYKNDPSMQQQSDIGDSPYEAAMKMFKDGCKFVGFINDIYSELPELLLGDECPSFIVAEMLRWGHDDMLLIGFKQLAGSYNVTSLWYKPIYKTDVVQAASEAEARRVIENKYERYQKSQSESDELFEGVYEVKPA